MLRRLAGGAGMLGLAGLLHRRILAAVNNPAETGLLSHPARARRVIFLFLEGGPSQIDLFDHKPELVKLAGEQAPELARRRREGPLEPSPFAFHRHGESGLELSELLPKVAGHADDLCVIRSLHTDIPNHPPAMLQMFTGSAREPRPSIGSWALYGLGCENDNLPGYLALKAGPVPANASLLGSAFLPAHLRGSAVNTQSADVEKLIQHLRSSKFTLEEQREQLDLLNELNRHHLDQIDGDTELEAEIRAMETAYRMQIEATDAFDLGGESARTRELYGDSSFGRSCLLARRLAERGVRFTTVHYSGERRALSWDTHGNGNEQLKTLCADADQAVGALLTDLKRRGLFEDTLVLMGGEFGRPPYAERPGRSGGGRGHQNDAFSMLLVGGGVRGGTTCGATDARGAKIAENPVAMIDLHATILHLLGIDHEQLTYHRAGRHFKLTDERARVVREIVA